MVVVEWHVICGTDMEKESVFYSNKVEEKKWIPARGTHSL